MSERALLNAGTAADPAAVSPPDITVVSTGVELKYALTEGHQDIEIREHIDLTGADDKLHALVYATTRSIRVRIRPLGLLLCVSTSP